MQLGALKAVAGPTVGSPSSQMSLSEYQPPQPDSKLSVPGAENRGNACFRICTWGEFIENGSGFRFCFFNIHLDHRGSQARKESARLILSRIKELAGADAPVILSGDFTNQTTEVYALFYNSELLDDSYEKAISSYAWTDTHNNFAPLITMGSRLDHIFVGPALKVIKYGILTEK